ncbi:hypothetical protein FACS189494_11130 [Spirochaetia bacterium]|nr:hypothetical protein FACS189494_11130 [Spirochaetia bacterium]
MCVVNLSISNIAWERRDDTEMYAFLHDINFAGLEIAPTTLFPDNPYEHCKEAAVFSKKLLSEYGLSVCSMQSIWYGRNENIFNGERENQSLVDYTRKAVDFAAAVGCGNLVFGCPKNRNVPAGCTKHNIIAIDFFTTIADYAASKGTVIAFEPNPLLYGTNFINTTGQAFSFARKITGMKVNIDCGTIIANGESLDIIADNADLVNHVHISEPNLEVIKQRPLHKELIDILQCAGYGGFVSIEMKNCGDIETVKNTVKYLRGIVK